MDQGAAAGSPKSRYALYDLRTDPGETRNLLTPEHRTAETPRVFAALSRALEEAVPPVEGPEIRLVPIEPAIEKRLENLGYLE